MITILLWHIIFTSCVEDECIPDQVSLASYSHEMVCRRVLIEMVRVNKDVEAATCALRPIKIQSDRIVRHQIEP